ncbi:MAG TPA: ATP-binding domain-containing protein [Aggregicoccus sp.]|nr:ATP-binding domain-containing protein [Aggregicoccus sp.]
MSAEAQRIVLEEETLLARTLAALAAARRRARGAQAVPGLAEELSALREEATTASAADLPHLFFQLDMARAVVERAGADALPDAVAPYFAHLRLQTAAGSRDFLLGRGSFTDAAADIRIIDWRTAPLARVFYNYDAGDSYEEYFGERLSEGTVEVRRLVVIERGVLTRISAGALRLEKGPDGQWRDAGAGGLLAGGAGTAVRPGALGVGLGARDHAGRFDVTALLDPQQYAALSVDADRPLLVLGSAGSGKTTVALHRLAKLAAGEKAQAGRHRLQVVVPEEGLARLARRLLAPLGLEKVPVKTLSAWAYDAARATFGVQRLRVTQDTPALVSRLKRHPALRPALQARLGVLKSSALSLAGLRRRLAEAYTDRPFLLQVVEAAGGDLPRTAVDETVRHTMAQLRTPLEREHRGIDPEALITVDGKSIAEDTPDELAGTWDLDDLPILMALKSERQALALERIAHLVLDETEDFSVFELYVLGRLLGEDRSCTVAGDEMQQTSSDFPGWPAVLQTLGVPDAELVRLQVSYRCPRPIVEVARQVLGREVTVAAPAPAREGVPVGFHHFPDVDPAQLFLRDALRDLLEREPKAAAAVIASSRESADAFYRVVQDMPGVRRVVDGQFSFEPGVDVTDVDDVKGLEWDYVILPDATARAYPQTAEARHKLHVAVTRASHQLWVVSSGLRSRLFG